MYHNSATADQYWIKAPEDERGWETGADKMLIVSGYGNKCR
jgi:hypothetical protein